MTKLKLLHLKNEMLVANFLANFIGAVMVQAVIFKAETETPLPDSLSDNRLFYVFDMAFTPLAFILVTAITLVYERPIRQYLTDRSNQIPISPELESRARRRILNEPFALIAVDFSMWLLAAILYPIAFFLSYADPINIQRSFVLNISTGIITVTVAFFLLEHVLQKRLASHFFPDGGLHKIPRTLRIRIRTRLTALLFACNLIPLFSILQIIDRITRNFDDPATAIELARSAIFTNGLIFIGVGIVLTVLVSRNLTLPFGEIIQSLRSVRNGNFDKKIQVTTNDEIGYTGDVINEMTEGLKERDRIRRSLGIAKEVQQHLLPRTAPEIDSLDIAGRSIYCEETGGDYFDYLPAGINGQEKIKIVVGDVSDHGIASALLMTTARAFIRQRASRTGNLDQIVGDINRQLSRDVEDSGRFMTLFFCEIDGRIKTIRWVNAGHDPAVIFDINSGGFEKLAGHALPLGVSDKTFYQEFQRQLQPGQIILIGTDGIWESQNSTRQMFGKERFRNVIRTHARKTAQEMLQAVIDELDQFCRPLKNEDDVTLVVVKVGA
ncbi:MAG: SpoIIE family protein phosphatase [Deltaproteobacteria bacterium]|nr:SpoIIE family protein phosphatase [Deltaproteobacteria bacterium]